MGVRPATEADAIRIVSILKNFHSYFNDTFRKDVPRVHSFIVACVRSPDAAVFVTGTPIDGVVISLADESVFAPIRFGAEKVLWVEPSARSRGEKWDQLSQAHEDWAREHSCQKSVLSARYTDRIDAMIRLYRRKGYHPTEIVFEKDID